MEEKYTNRLAEIDKRIKDLEAHRGMWSRAGGGKMAMRAVEEIASLKAEKERILSGTQEKIDKIEEHINDLKQLKAQCHAINFIRKMKLNGEIKGYEQQKSGYMSR